MKQSDSVKKELTVTNNIEELQKIKDSITDLVATSPTLENAEFEMILIAEELFTNTVYYGFADADTHEIQMSFVAGDGYWEIIIQDDGIPFDPTAAPEPDTTAPLAERMVGGLGIHLIRKIADAFEYERKDGRNIVVVKKGSQRI